MDPADQLSQFFLLLPSPLVSPESLLESAAGEVLEGVHADPLDREESRKNVEKVLQFIASRHIRMPHISARGKSSSFSPSCRCWC